MAELRSTIQSVYNVTDGNSMVAYNLVVDHQVHAGALMSNDDQIVVQLNKTVGDVVEQLAFNSDTLTAAYATSGSTGLVWNISGTTALLKCASGAAWKNEDIIISATINNIVVDKERISYSSSTPILELSNDVGSLMYSADGSTKLKNNEVATTSATIYVNGNAVPTAQVQFNWNIIDGVGTSSANTVTVSAINLNAFKAQAVCTATFNGSSYQKSFDVMRNTQGVKGEKGDNGKPGEKGDPGDPGKDADKVEVKTIYGYLTYNEETEAKKENKVPKINKPSVYTDIGNYMFDGKKWMYSNFAVSANAPYKFMASVTIKISATDAADITLLDCTTPILIKALPFGSSNVDDAVTIPYASFLNLTNWGLNQGLYWNNGQVYINAEYIKTGILQIGAAGSIRFYANANPDTPVVQIGGFQVDGSSLYSGSTNNELIFLSTGTANSYTVAGQSVSNLMIKAGSNFGITKDGTVYAAEGRIGGWQIAADGLSKSGVGLYTDTGEARQSLISSQPSYVRFYAGNTTPASAPFMVLEDGSLYAGAASITGTINAGAGTIGGLKISTITPSTVMKSTTKTTTVNITIPPQSTGTEIFIPSHGYLFGVYIEFPVSILNLPEDAVLGSITILSPTYPDPLTWGATWADLTDFKPLGSNAGFTITASTFIRSKKLTQNVSVSIKLQYTYYQSVIAGPTESATTKISSIDGTFSVVTKDQKSSLTSNISNISTLYGSTAYLDVLYNGDVVLKDGILSYMGSNVYFDNSTKDFLYKAYIYSDFTYFIVYLNKPLSQDKTFQIQYTTTSNLAISTPVAVTIPAGQYSVTYRIPDDELSLVTFIESKTQELTFTMATKQSYDLAYNGNGLIFDSIPLLPKTGKSAVTELSLSNTPGFVGNRLGGELGNIIGYRWWEKAYIYKLYTQKLISPDNGGVLQGIWRYYKPNGWGLEIRQTDHITTESGGVRIGDPFMQFWSMEGSLDNNNPTMLLSIYEEYNSDKIETGGTKQDSLIVFNAPNRLLSFRGTSNNDSSNTFYGNWYFSNGQVGFGQPAYFEKEVINKDGGVVFTSSRVSKTNISTFDVKHELLFDSLLPKQFAYKSGTSQRLHYGFILDEVGAALQKAGLTTQECAAYCLDDLSNPNGDGGLRYDEFIALNTWQIQLLKPRISDLEQRCIILEARVKELEEKYENIQ